MTFKKFSTKNPPARDGVFYRHPSLAQKNETFTKDIEYLLSKGMTPKEIAEELGRTANAVSMQMRRYGLKTPKKSNQ